MSIGRQSLLQEWRVQVRASRAASCLLAALVLAALACGHRATAQGTEDNAALVLEGHGDQVDGVAFSPDGETLLTGSWDNTARIWNAIDGTLIHTLSGPTDWITSVAFSPDGTKAITGGWDSSVIIWDTATGKEVLQVKVPTGNVTTVGFSHDGTRFFGGIGTTCAGRIYDFATGQPLLELSTSNRTLVLDAAYSLNDTEIATGEGNGVVEFRDAQTAALVRKSLSGHSESVSAVDFHPTDATRFLTGSWDGTAKIWNLQLGQALLTLTGHQAPVTDAVFSPDGKWVATASLDTTVVFWNAFTGERVCVLELKSGSVRAVAFSPDGSRIATGHGNWTAQIRPVPSELR
jgi:WD40 repeat protein